MRKRKRELTHSVRCFKFRAYFKSESSLLPAPVYAFAKKQQKLWNLLSDEQERRWTEWKTAHAGTKVVGVETTKFEKPPQTWWDEYATFAKAQAAASGLGWDSSEDVVTRLESCLKRLSKGGGAPKRQGRLNCFSIRHRYTSGGLPVASLENQGQRRFRILFGSRLTSAWFRVDSEVMGLNVVMHRPLPEEGIVKQVRLTGWKQSPVLPWVLHLVFTMEEPNTESPSSTGRAIGIDVGWRKLDEERLRVAVSYDGTNHEELLLPLRYVHHRLGEVSLGRIRGCQQMKDRLLEQCKAALKTVLPKIPPGFTQMRNGGLIWLLRQLQEAAPDSPAIAILERWKRDNDRLQAKVLLLQNAMTGRRRHLYREYAARLVKKYDLIGVEKLDLPKLYDREKTEAEYALSAAAERRRYASCGELFAGLDHAVRKAGRKIEVVKAAHTTDLCSKCGAKFEAGSQVVGKCEKGHVMDQDWNAASNIYANLMGLRPMAQVA